MDNKTFNLNIHLILNKNLKYNKWILNKYAAFHWL